MAAVNGTLLLLYSEGVAVAMQRGLSISVEQDLPDATNKESAGWARHLDGILSGGIDFDGLFSTGLLTDNPAVMGAKDLMDYIINRESMLIEVLGLTYPIVAEVDMSSLKIGAPMEGGMTLAGSLKFQGEPYVLNSLPAGYHANLITDPDAGGTDYDTLTVSGLTITSAIKSTAGAKFCQSNTLGVTNTHVYKLAVFIKSNSGALPTVGIWDNTSAYISNTSVLVAGLNIVTLTATATDTTASLRFSNTANANWSTGNIYLFKV
jgi:hypothetical protein